MSFWKRREPELDTVDDPTEPLDPKAFLALVEAVGRSCVHEVKRLGGDADEVLGTVWFTEKQEVSRVQLTSDGRPLPTGKAFSKDLTQQAVPFRAQPEGGRLDRIELTVADGTLSTEVNYRR
ncbi:hypothetical protein [Demetria terragena]|uniref:hypothetical protein n=1 Tax=Demetria terragena TaxID=63959 RepID=UPI0003656D23|nr:hypothetical protein [Demetria terragena]